MRNGGLNTTLPEGNKNNLRWFVSLGGHITDPMTAGNSRYKMKRVMKGEKDVGKIDEAKQDTAGDQLYALQRVEVAERLTPQKIPVLVGKDSFSTVLQFDMDGNQRISLHVPVEKISI